MTLLDLPEPDPRPRGWPDRHLRALREVVRVAQRDPSAEPTVETLRAVALRIAAVWVERRRIESQTAPADTKARKARDTAVNKAYAQVRLHREVADLLTRHGLPRGVRLWDAL